MPKSFYALITPVDPGAHPDHGLPGEPPGIWPGGHPEHPIVLPPEKPGDPPVVIWPDPGPFPIPTPPIYYPPSIWPRPGHPAHPIAPGGEHPMPPIYYPPIIWPQPPEGGPPIIIDPPHPEHPIVLPPIVWPDPNPPHPAHPIVIPLPPEIWPRPGHPEHPIVIPPEQPPEGQPVVDWKVGWTQEKGWVVVGIIIPEFPHPAPSRREARRAK